LNVPDRHRVLGLVAERFPDRDPVTAVMSWVEELANTKALGSAESNVLGIEGVDGDYLFVLECMLRGMTPEQTIQAFVEDSPASDTGNLETIPENLYRTISNSLPFKSIF